MYPTDLTVSAVIEDNGRYLLVEEHAMGDALLSGMIPIHNNVDAVLANADLV